MLCEPPRKRDVNTFVQNLGISATACNGRRISNFAKLMSNLFGVVLDPRSRRRPRPSGALTDRRAIATERVTEARKLSEGRNSCCDARAQRRPKGKNS